MLTILFDGIAYGMLLFVLACGLSVTLGLMNFVNLAHGAFAMAGGYVTVVAGRTAWACRSSPRCRSPSSSAALLGAVLERMLYVALYPGSHLDQVLFTIGLVFMAVAAVDYIMGSQQQIVDLPECCRAASRSRRRHRRLPAVHHRRVRRCCRRLQLILTQTRFGSRLRAAVDDQRVARGLGINVGLVFAVTFAVGSGLAGLGGALGAEICSASTRRFRSSS